PTRVPTRPEGAVLVLHGGARREGRPMVSPTQLSVLRMIPVAHRIARAGAGRLAGFRLLNSYRGGGGSHTPLDDVAWALGQVRERFGHLPACLVGHSLGGRAALLAGGAEEGGGVGGVDPWVHPTDPPDLAGRRVLVVHGTADRIAELGRAEAVARRIGRTADVEFVAVP